MSESLFIAEFFHSGIFELSTIITLNFLDNLLCSIANNFDVIDDELTCFILGLKEESSGESCKVINNDNAILFLAY